MSLTLQIRHQLGGFSLDVEIEAPSGITVLFGRSGAGKTLILQSVAGLMRPDFAKIRVGGKLVADTSANVFLPPRKRRLGVIFQEPRLFPHLTVRQNLNYGARFAPKTARRPDFDNLVDMLGLEHVLSRQPARLSGGEKQRVAIGRALLSAPELILADEPLSALDDARKQDILPYFELLRDRFAVPVVYVTHAATEVARLATTVVALEHGRVLKQGPAMEVLSDPMVTPTGAGAVGAVLNAVVVAHADDGLTELQVGDARLWLPSIPVPVGREIRVRIAAHEILIALQDPSDLSATNVLPCHITAIRSGEGPGAIVSLQCAAGTLLARITRRSVTSMGLKPGKKCFAVIKALAIARENVGI